MKKSIFLDLPYWSTLFIRHNIDVMHIEKNVFDNIFNTVMDIKGKTKDNMNTRRDLKMMCNRPELELGEHRPNVMPKAVYTLGKEQKMRKLIPIAFLEMLPEHVWSALTEVSLLFQSTCSTMLDVHKLHELENSVAIILCNLEKIFPPAFFNSMENLIVHLPYEARTGGPVQYRWMYPFERFLCELKKKVKNKMHVEASIVKAYIVEEIGLFTSQASGATKKKWLSGPERHIINTYILTNCEVVTPYYKVHPELNYTDKELLKYHYWGPSAEVTSFHAYFVNGYNFPTERHNTGKSTMNCKCRWVDPVRGMKVHPSYHFVDVNFKKLYQKDDPFILAQQAVQTETVAYQSGEVVPVPIVAVDNQSYDLRDPNGLQVVLEAAEAVSQPPPILADSGAVGSAAAGPPAYRSWPGRGMHQHHSFPTTGPEALHQPPRWEVSYWWDCDDESMFKLVKSQAGKFLQKRHSRPRIRSTERPIRKQQRPSIAAGHHPLGRTSASYQSDGGVRESVQKEGRRSVERPEGRGGRRGVLEAIEGTPRRREQQRGTGTLVLSLHDPLRAAVVDVSSWRSEKGPSIRSQLRGPPHDCWTITSQQQHRSYALAATAIE
ncbi:UNVERIFIED_CONTAM: hypothetical protein Scaly_2194500 [Sesamum calycinum]|uniref:DUF4218 domain-containing protein n=1 Tax=Sesamum calycinum TaxID=2727403 RepID=A0AAW2MP25_9LAMI